MSTPPSDWRIRLLLEPRNGGLGEAKELRARKITIGRARDCDLSINHMNASRRHCWLYVSDDEQLRIEDGKSSNGTFVNGTPIHDVPFEMGDRLCLGDLMISLLDRPGPGDPLSQVLVMVRGPDPEWCVTLNDRETVVGRGSMADLLVDDPSLEHRHARFDRNGDGAFYVAGLPSGGAVRVNGRTVGTEPTALAIGDLIELGDVVLRLEERSLELFELMAPRLLMGVERDTRTGLRTRFALERALKARFADTSSLSLVGVKITNVKSIYDTIGYWAVDWLINKSAERCLAFAERHESEVPLLASEGRGWLVLVVLGDEAAARTVAERVVDTVCGTPFVFESNERFEFTAEVNTAVVERSDEHTEAGTLVQAVLDAIDPGDGDA